MNRTYDCCIHANITEMFHCSAKLSRMETIAFDSANSQQCSQKPNNYRLVKVITLRKQFRGEQQKLGEPNENCTQRHANKANGIIFFVFAEVLQLFADAWIKSHLHRVCKSERERKRG